MTDFAIKLLTSKLGKTHLFFVGQAGFIIKSSGGQFLAIDIYLSDCVERLEKYIGFKRLLPKILNPFECEFEVIIATHPHLDHFDMDSIPILMSNGKTHLFASVNCENEVKKFLLDTNRITYVKPNESFNFGDFKIDFVPCDHGEGAPDAVGVIVNVDGKSIYSAGDTCLRMDRIDFLKNKGDIDILIAPINGAYGNMNEEECAKFNNALNSKLVIPCHYGMFAAHGGNLGKFIKIMDEKYPQNKYKIMAMGESLTL